MSDDYADPKPHSPIIPVKLSLDDKIQFQCHKDIACFNECCRNIDILLTPYDILRLKKRLGLTSQQFLSRHAVPFEMDGHGMPGLKMKTKEDSAECQFLTEGGCGVYEDRPAACRYYALGLTSMRKKDSPTDEDFYFIVKEDHCLGHNEPRTLTVREYRKEQGVNVYDDMNHEWRQIILKKRSCGPTVGRPSDRSMDLFFQASYDLDGFREFVRSKSFNEVYELEAAFLDKLMNDDDELLKFAFRFLKQSLYGEQSISVHPDAMGKRLARAREREAKQRQELEKD